MLRSERLLARTAPAKPPVCETSGPSRPEPKEGKWCD